MKSFTSKPPSRVSDRVSVYTPRLNTRPNLIFNNLNPAGSYNFKDLERAVLYFILFYFILFSDAQIWFLFTQYCTKPPTHIQYGLKIPIE
jgi:hypothetical protein